MSKQVLGRGLSHLLDGKPTSPVKEPGRAGTPPGRGVGRLLNGGEQPAGATIPVRSPANPKPPAGAPASLPKWPFFLVDFLLLSLVGAFVWNSARPLSIGAVLVAVLGTLAGAISALLPIWWEARRKPVAPQPQSRPAVRLRIYLQ